MQYLSHYTNRLGLEGIARSKTFWATNFLDVRDTTELVYGLAQISKHALKHTLAELPAVMKQREYNDAELEQLEKSMCIQLRDAVVKAQGDGHLFITSFAAAKNPDHDRRGIRSLWNQVGEDGYCLQFSMTDLQNLVRHETERFSYAVINFAPVSYRIDENDSGFQQLRFQLQQRLLQFITTHRPDLEVRPQYERFWAEGAFVAKLVAFCARHKDPYFEDEREFRILAFPADTAASRPFIGIALKKRPLVGQTGKRYIEIGEGWQPGIEPKRIIVGPRASRDLSGALQAFRTQPEISYAEVPER